MEDDEKSLNMAINVANFILFSEKDYLKRNTVNYSKDERRIMQDEAVSIYKTIAKKLHWPKYWKQIRQLLFKLDKARKQKQEADIETDQEKIYAKLVCAMLESWHFGSQNTDLEEVVKFRGKFHETVEIEMPEIDLFQEMEN